MPGKLPYKKDARMLIVLCQKGVSVPLRAYVHIQPQNVHSESFCGTLSRNNMTGDCFKIDTPIRGETIPRNAPKAGNWYLLGFFFQSFRRAPQSFLYGIPPGCKSRRVYIGFCFFLLSIGCYS